MFCRKCGNPVYDGQLNCTVCGEAVTQTGNQASYNNGGFYSDNMYSQPNNGFRAVPSSNNGFYAAGNQMYPGANMNDRIPEVKDYLKWTLLYPLAMLIPGVGFIVYLVISLKFAFDKTYIARANFFKATLIAQLIALGAALLVFIFVFAVFGSAVFAGFDMLDEVYPEIFNELKFGCNMLKMLF